MATLIFGLVVIAIALYALNAFSKVNPRTAAVVLKTGGGVGALALAGVLGLLGWLPWSIPGFGERTRKRAGQMSRVRAAFLEMELDHDSGAMRGRILAERHQGAALETLEVPVLVALLAE